MSTEKAEPQGPPEVAPAKGTEIGVLRPTDAPESLEAWNSFVDESPQGCIFCRSWWLNTVCPGSWEILLLRRGGRIIAGLPLVPRRAHGFRVATMPPLTQTLGVLLAPPRSESYEKRLSADMEATSELLAALPRFAYFSVKCHGNFTNWLPFYWQGYRQTTVYSYALEDLSDLEKVFASFAHAKRKNIKKAESEVTVREDLAAREFYDNHQMTLAAQGEQISYSFDFFERIYKTTHERGAGKTWWATDAAGNIHAAIFIIFDARSAYYLISTIDPRFRNSGAATLLVKKALEYVAPRTKRFDFEGSMIQGVEQSFRKFGAVQKPYFVISKDNLPFPLKLAAALFFPKWRTMLGL